MRVHTYVDRLVGCMFGLLLSDTCRDTILARAYYMAGGSVYVIRHHTSNCTMTMDSIRTMILQKQYAMLVLWPLCDMLL